jgi:hypothetical protein
MNDTKHDDALTRALRRVKEADEALSASPEVEVRLLDEVRRLQSVKRGWSRQMIATLAAASIVVLTIAIGLWLRPVPAPPAVVEAAQEVTTEFFPLFYASVPAIQSHVVRMELPRASLARFGLMSADGIDHVSGTVLADVLVGDDGLARAVRFVRKLSVEQRQ